MPKRSCVFELRSESQMRAMHCSGPMTRLPIRILAACRIYMPTSEAAKNMFLPFRPPYRPETQENQSSVPIKHGLTSTLRSKQNIQGLCAHCNINQITDNCLKQCCIWCQTCTFHLCQLLKALLSVRARTLNRYPSE